MTQATPETFDAFAYQAQTAEGQTVAGTIDAPNLDLAQRMLQSLRLRVLSIEPVRQPRPKRLNGVDFLSFNQQLMHLTSAGLPVEHGLRLIAQDMRSGRLKTTVEQVAGELERGTPLGEAFEKHKDKFPPLYSRLITAGVASSNLPGMLLNLGRHMEMVYRLRATLWRVMSYPLMVMVALGLVVAFITTSLIPKFEVIYHDFGTKLPALTEFLLSTTGWVPRLLLGLAIAILLMPVAWWLIRRAGMDRAFVDTFIVPMPLVGPVLKRNLVARWCDAVRMGVEAGLDLPRAIELAGDAVGSPKLKRDGHEMIGALGAGRQLDAVIGTTRLLPATVPAAMTLAANANDLPNTLGTLAEMYQQQAETRLNLVPGILMPILIIAMALIIGLVILGLFLPLISLIQNISGGGK